VVIGIKNAVALDVATSLGCVVDNAATLFCFTDRTADTHGPAPSLAARPDALATDVLDVSLSLAAKPSVCVRKKNGDMACTSAERQALPVRPFQTEATGTAAIATGDMVRCVLRDQGAASCWGSTFLGFKEQTQALGGPPWLTGAGEVSAGSAFACAIDANQQVKCLGDAKGTPPAGPVQHVRLGVYHGCVIDQQGRVRCWGDNRFGQLGSAFGPVEGVSDAVDVAVGNWHTCALEKNGRVLCWGRNSRGQLGDGSTANRAEARAVSLPLE
jgi:alpha-tubulin suppressor-like RCC1 family protein